MNRTCFLMLLLGAIGTAVGQNAGASNQTSPTTGVLIMSHGGAASWNEAVLDIVRQVDRNSRAEAAFGMATRANLQTAVDKLAARGVREIIAVPLFISSHSSVITSTEYLLGKRTEMPEDLKLFARMNHGGGEHKHDTAAEDGTRPVKWPVPIRMTAALNAHPIVSDILIDRANSISRRPSKEVVIVVAHGPTPESENQKWLADLRILTDRMKERTKFHRIDYLTVRDDAPEPIRTKAAEEFRGLVQRATSEVKRALVVPLLLSYGGIEAGLRRRLEGLEFSMASQALLPDARLVDWVLDSVRTAH